MLFCSHKYKGYSKEEPLLVKVAFGSAGKTNKNQQEKRNPGWVSEGGDGKHEERAVGMGAFPLTFLLKCVSGSWGWIS